jgi:hypothetical protein
MHLHRRRDRLQAVNRRVWDLVIRGVSSSVDSGVDNLGKLHRRSRRLARLASPSSSSPSPLESYAALLSGLFTPTLQGCGLQSSGWGSAMRLDVPLSIVPNVIRRDHCCRVTVIPHSQSGNVLALIFTLDLAGRRAWSGPSATCGIRSRPEGGIEERARCGIASVSSRSSGSASYLSGLRQFGNQRHLLLLDDTVEICRVPEKGTPSRFPVITAVTNINRPDLCAIFVDQVRRRNPSCSSDQPV